MSVPVRVRLAVAAVLGVAGGIAMWRDVAPMEPFLDIETVRAADGAGVDAWDLVVTARGDETVDEVRVEGLSGAVHVVGPATATGLARGAVARFRIHLDPRTDDTIRGVRVRQSGTSPRSYDLPIGSPK